MSVNLPTIGTTTEEVRENAAKSQMNSSKPPMSATMLCAEVAMTVMFIVTTVMDVVSVATISNLVL